MSRSARAFVVVGFTTIYFSYVFRFTTGAPFAYGLAGWHDANFINALLEHWYFCLLRLDNPVSPPMFYPATGTLGYSHGLILFAPFYVLVRPFVDAFLAHTLTIFLAAELGAICLYALLRRAGIGFLEALVLTAFFCTSANIVDPGTGVWSQRASVFLVPPILLVLSSSVRMKPGALRLALGFLGGFLASLLPTQDFYTAAFAVIVFGLLLPAFFFQFAKPAVPVDGGQVMPRARPHDAWLACGALLLLVAFLIALDPIERIDVGGLGLSARDPLRPLVVGLLCIGWYIERRWMVSRWLAGRVAAVPWSEWRLTGAVGVGAVVGFSIFVWAYLGSYREHQAFPDDQLWFHLQRPTADWRSVGRLFNLVTYESGRTFVLVLLSTLLALTPALRVGRIQRLQLVWLSLVSMIVLAIPLRTDDVSFWKQFFGWLPGLTAIRDPKRVIFLYELGAVLALAVALAGAARRSSFRMVVTCLAIVLMVYDWNGKTFDYGRSREQFDRWVHGAIAIAPECRSFFIKDTSASYRSRSDNLYSLYGSDALFVALRVRLPTLHGYSAWVPPGYQMLHPDDADYIAHVKAWIQRNQLKDVCALDMDARTMTPFRE